MESIVPLMAIEWPSFLNNPDCIVFVVPITFILIYGIMGMAKLCLRHRERMTMIERGMHPDHPPDPDKQTGYDSTHVLG
jgi:hypothetical protein